LATWQVGSNPTFPTKKQRIIEGIAILNLILERIPIMAKRDFKGVWIPKQIYLNNSLSWPEKILLIEIDSLDKDWTKKVSTE